MALTTKFKAGLCHRSQLGISDWNWAWARNHNNLIYCAIDTATCHAFQVGLEIAHDIVEVFF